MKGKVFVDTNILIYAHDIDADFKRDIAASIIEKLWEKKNGVISVQVLQEFYVNVTRKIRSPIPPDVARSIIRNYLTWNVVVNKPKMVLQASEIGEKNSLSFWDSMIIAAACMAKSKIILTEDMNHGQKIEGILIENPFIKKQ